MKYYIFLLLTLFVTSCQNQDKNVREQSDNYSRTVSEVFANKLKLFANNFGVGRTPSEKALEAWAEAYFNFDYETALQHVTPESEQWIRFAASNITEQDIDFIKKENPPTEIDILNSQMTEGDTVCNANIRVSHFIQLGLSTEDNRVIDHADFQVQLVKRGDEWLVRMEGLPQSGMQSRD